jgi:hypothetical protein
MSTLTVANLQGTPASANIITVPTGHTLRSATTGGIYIPGSVIQVVTATMTSTFSSSGTTPAAVTGLAVTITPRFSTSKVVVFGQLYGNGTSGSTQLFAYLYRNGSIVNTGVTAASGQLANCIGRYYIADANISGTIPYSWTDNPATTSAITYQIYVGAEAAAAVYVNRTQNDAAANNGARCPSVITAMEIGV